MTTFKSGLSKSQSMASLPQPHSAPTQAEHSGIQSSIMCCARSLGIAARLQKIILEKHLKMTKYS